MNRPLVDNRLARRLFLDRHCLLRSGAGEGSGADLDGVLDDLGFVQVDSVNTLARAHDLILWSRRGQYRPKALENLVSQRRTAFEHWTHDAAVIPMKFYPMWRLKFERDGERIQARWSQGKRDALGAEMAKVLGRITEHGPTCSLDVASGEREGSSGWWDWHPSKAALDYLWRAGQIAVCHRRGFRKFYDLAERVIPAEHREIRYESHEIIEWAMLEALRRLGFATSTELAAFFEIATKDEAKAWCAQKLQDGLIIEADIELSDGARRCCFTTQSTLDDAAALPEPSSRVRILSPFDPALRDRARAERLFGFDYRIEIFVPEAKRRFGYYVFPVMQGDRMIGRLDAKRDSGAIKVRAFWPESRVQMGKGRTAALVSELHRISHLAKADAVDLSQDWLRE